MAYIGQDFSTFLVGPDGLVASSDMDLSFTPVSPNQGCVERLVRKQVCPPGSMDDAGWGIDLRSRLNAGLLPGDLQALQQALRVEVMKEEYVEDVAVTCVLDSEGRLVVDETVTLSDLSVWQFAFALPSTGGVQAVLGVAQNAN